MSSILSYVSSPQYGLTPAPACSVKFSKQQRTITAEAMIDTGASATGIPYSLITFFNLRPVGSGLVGGADLLHLEQREIYVLTIEFQGFFYPNHPVYRIANEYPLIGRDILNRYFIQLNGPALNFRVDETQQ